MENRPKRGREFLFKILKDFPASLKILEACKPIYETLPGWTEDISGATEIKDLPLNVRNYLKRIEELIEFPIHIISVGPERNQTIVKKNPFLPEL